MEADVLIDLEGIVRLDRAARYPEGKVNWLLTNLPNGLEKLGYSVRSIWAVARTRYLSARRRQAISQVFKDHKATLVLCDEVADTVLKREIANRLAAKLLPKHIVLITNDGHFAPDVMHLIHESHYVIAMGSGMNKQLQKVATQVEQLHAVIGKYFP